MLRSSGSPSDEKGERSETSLWLEPLGSAFPEASSGNKEIEIYRTCLEPYDNIKHSRSLDTSWAVVTGVSCAGKTSLLNLLKALGESINISDMVRNQLNHTGERLGSIAAAKKNSIGILEEALQAQYEHQQALSFLHSEPLFFDKSHIDIRRELKAAGGEPGPELALTHQLRFGHVFVCEPLPFVQDGFRTNRSIEERAALTSEVVRSYEEAGYRVIRVPPAQIDKRIAIILKTLRPAMEDFYAAQRPRFLELHEYISRESDRNFPMQREFD